MIRHGLMAALTALACLAGARAMAADTMGRVGQAGEYTFIQEVCDKVGYRVDSGQAESIAQAIIDDAKAQRWGDQAVDDRFMAAAKQTEAGFKAKADILKAAGDVAVDDPSYRRGLTTAAADMLDFIAIRCDRASRDPAFGKAIVAQGPAAMAKARLESSDRLLAGFGVASFQPPEALARGDLLYATGLCKFYLSAADLQLYRGDVLDGPDPVDPDRLKLRKWYAEQYQDGLDGAGKLDRAECAETMPRMLAKAKTTRVAP